MIASLSVVVPLWNEEKNILNLIESIAASNLTQIPEFELVLVNNGSKDNTRSLIDSASARYSWLTPIHLKENRNYGGGIQVGIEKSKNNYVVFIPGDLQVSVEDVEKIWNRATELIKNGERSFLVKGYRVRRFDGINTKFVSRVYTMLANFILKTKTKDLNALPKLLSKDLYNSIKGEKMTTFVFDAQVLLTAREQRVPVIEIPVTFYARREGVSSWSGKRLKVYIQSFKLLLKLRRQNNQQTIRL